MTKKETGKLMTLCLLEILIGKISSDDKCFKLFSFKDQLA